MKKDTKKAAEDALSVMFSTKKPVVWKPNQKKKSNAVSKDTYILLAVVALVLFILFLVSYYIFSGNQVKVLNEQVSIEKHWEVPIADGRPISKVLS